MLDQIKINLINSKQVIKAKECSTKITLRKFLGRVNSRQFFGGAHQKVFADPWYREQQNYAFYKDNGRLLLSRIQTLNNIP